MTSRVVPLSVAVKSLDNFSDDERGFYDFEFTLEQVADENTEGLSKKSISRFITSVLLSDYKANSLLPSLKIDSKIKSIFGEVISA